MAMALLVVVLGEVGLPIVFPVTAIPLDEQEIGFNDFIRNLEVPKLSNEEQASLEDNLTLEEKKCLTFVWGKQNSWWRQFQQRVLWNFLSSFKTGFT